MSKKFSIIVVNLVIILIVAFWLMHEIDTYKGLKSVVVAKVPITKGAKITSQMVEIKKVTLNQEGKKIGGSKGLVTYYSDVFQDIKKVENNYAKYDLVPGEIIVASKIADDFSFADSFLYQIPKGYYAVPVSLKGDAGVCNINDYIDLYCYVNEAYIEEPSLRHLKIYDLRYDDGTSVNEKKAEDDTVKIPTKAIVALNDYQVKKLYELQVKKADMLIGIRKRSTDQYASFEYQDINYPSFAISPDELIDLTREEQLIEEYRLRVESAQIEQQNEGLVTQPTTQPITQPSTQPTAQSTTQPAADNAQQVPAQQ